jgi:ABC-2 type transport system permease protein
VRTLRQSLTQARWQNRAFWRNPAAAFFTFVFPLMFLVIFTSIFKDDAVTLPTGVKVTSATYYTAGILAFAVITATFTYVANNVVALRDEGVLKRVRGTPLPPLAYILGKILHSVFLMVILVVVVLAFGFAFYDVDLPTTSLAAFVVALAVGAAAFCAMGLACATVTPNPEAAPAVTNAVMLPMLFLSGVFFPVNDAPAWMRAIGNVFPVKHFMRAATEGFLPPPGHESGWRWADVAVVAAWGVAALLFVLRNFRWEPRR